MPEQGEETRLCRPVLIERPVEVEVLVREVCKDGDVKRTPSDPLKREGMGADLDDGVLHPGGNHLGQSRLNLRRLGGRMVGRIGLGPVG